MASSTPEYDLPYLELDDAPDIAGATEALAEAVETELSRIDASVATLNGLTPVRASSSVDDSTTGTTFTPGANAQVGVAFTAPASGIVFVTLTAYVQQAIDGQAAIVSYDLKTGSTVGSGAVVSAANADRAIVAGRVVNSGSVFLIQASHREMFTGLTPGTAYNVRVMFQTTSGGNATVLFRQLIVEPSL